MLDIPPPVKSVSIDGFPVSRTNPLPAAEMIALIDVKTTPRLGSLTNESTTALCVKHARTPELNAVK